MSTTQQVSESAHQHWMELEHKYYQGTFKRYPLVFVRGEGTRVWDTDGKDYLDLVAGIAVNVLGHCHPAVVSAIQEQATRLVHVSNLYYNTLQIELAEQLGLLSNGMRSFFSNSGAEANEGAIKLARKFGRTKKNGAFEIISMERSFHGRTLATTAATGQAHYQATWAPLPDGFKQVPYNDLDALKAAVSDKTAGILLEAVQGEGGIWPADKAFMEGVRQLCDEQNMVMICDEVQAGMGRTGKFFAWENYPVTPDIVTMAKGLAGGVPIGGMLAGKRADLFEPGDHGTTFGGNPVVCAAALAVLDTIVAESLLDRATTLGERLRRGLAEPFQVTEVRGRGLLLGIDVTVEAPQVVTTARSQGFILNATGPHTVRLAPPLVLGDDEAEAFLAAWPRILDTAGDPAADNGAPT